MKEFIEKLISKLEEKHDLYSDEYDDYGIGRYAAYEDAIEIVKELAEEYKPQQKSEWKNKVMKHFTKTE